MYLSTTSKQPINYLPPKFSPYPYLSSCEVKNTKWNQMSWVQFIALLLLTVWLSSYFTFFYLSFFISKMGMIALTLTGDCLEDKMKDCCTNKAFKVYPSTRPMLWKCWLSFVLLSLGFNCTFITWISTYLCCFLPRKLKSDYGFYFISSFRATRDLFSIVSTLRQLFDSVRQIKLVYKDDPYQENCCISMVNCYKDYKNILALWTTSCMSKLRMQRCNSKEGK